MFKVCLINKDIVKVSHSEAMALIAESNCLNKTLFERIEDAKYCLVFHLYQEISDMKLKIKTVNDLTLDDVSQLGLF